MHLRIAAVLIYAILVGFATTTQVVDKSYYAGEIDIDDDLEGSGGDTEVSHDLEASGSGFGPDDEDSPRTVAPHNGDIPKTIDPTSIPKTVNRKPNEDIVTVSKEGTSNLDSVVIMNPKSEERPTFFAQPGILAAVIGGAVVGLLCAILVVMFIVYRMRKKDEGSYALEEPKRSPTSNSYNRGNSKEFYA